MKKILLSIGVGLVSYSGFAFAIDGGGQQGQLGQQTQLGQQSQQAGQQSDDSLARLQTRCQALAAHDQIKKFQVKVNFKGYFMDYKPVTSCYGLGNNGGYQLGISMKSNRFQSQTYQGKLTEGTLQVPCTIVQARKIQVKQDSPQLTLQLDNCDQLNKAYIQKLLIDKIKESYEGDPEMYSVVGWKPVIPEACASLQKVAEKVLEGDCK
jgi:hypothetical protein